MPGAAQTQRPHAIRSTKTVVMRHVRRNNTVFIERIGSEVTFFTLWRTLYFFLRELSVFLPKMTHYKTRIKMPSLSTFAHGLDWKSFFQTSFWKNDFPPRPCAKTRVSEAFQTLSPGFYSVFWNHYKTAARLRKTRFWAHNFDFHWGIQGISDARARKVL